MADDAKSTVTKRASAATTKPPPPPVEEPPKRVEDESEGGWRRFMWNEDTREFFGRTGMSWLLITIFYLIFFGALAAFFLFNWFGALAVISVDEPYKHGKKGLLAGDGPGISFRPTPDRERNAVSTLVWSGTGTYEDYQFWSEQLETWFKAIPKADHPNVKTCSPKDRAGEGTKTACFIENKIASNRYGLCSSTGYGKNDFGYDRGEPCILVKLNRIYGWKPEPCTGACRKKAGADLQAYIESVDKQNSTDGTGWTVDERMYIWCDGEHDHDKENLGAVEYFPGPYIQRYYYPFLNQKNYQSPFIMIQLKRPIPGVLISIECTMYADNVEVRKLDGIGYTRFQVMIE